ncbi:hypothetical protein BC827DRAFT_1173727 [Russula dissimulans]|nr:hypothetical protein BC827DRAFT_1173727 [Russula dissimulans]
MSTTPQLYSQGTLAESKPEPFPWPPFDDARADITLRSSDGVNFRVFKAILSIASPVFADMFKIPPPTSRGASPNDDVPQVFPVSERSGDLDFSLRHLYPIRLTNKVAVVSLGSVGALAEFSRKYRINGLTKTITRYLMDRVQHDPVDVYAIALTYGYKDIAAKAARSCLNFPFSRLHSLCMQHIAVGLHVELLRYHVACGEAASAVASERDWLSSLSQDSLFISIGSKTEPQCSACTTQDFTDQTYNPYGALLSTAQHLVLRLRWPGVTRKNIRPIVFMELLASRCPRSGMPSDCRDGYYEKIRITIQRLLLVCRRYAKTYARTQHGL